MCNKLFVWMGCQWIGLSEEEEEWVKINKNNNEKKITEIRFLWGIIYWIFKAVMCVNGGYK